jgi:hypothetical protein
MPRCPACGGGSFRLDEVAADRELTDGGRESLGSTNDAGTSPRECVLTCSGCDTVLGAAAGARLAELQHEVQLVREELNRLRQAVNFLNQRVR